MTLTELKAMQRELSQQKALLTSLIKAFPDMVFLKDAQGVYQACNPVFERFMGRSERDILGRTDAQLMSSHAAEHFARNDQQAMQAWQPLVFEETVTFAADGYQGQFETIKTPIRDPAGRATGVLGVSRDITDRKRAAQEMAELGELMELWQWALERALGVHGMIFGYFKGNRVFMNTVARPLADGRVVVHLPVRDKFDPTHEEHEDPKAPVGATPITLEEAQALVGDSLDTIA